MATQKITIIKSNEAYNNSFEFDIPEEAGTYNLSFTRENNAGTINAGNFIVDETERTYQLKLALSNGQEVVAGTFKTQVANKPTVLTLNNTTGAEEVVSTVIRPLPSTTPIVVKLNGTEVGQHTYDASKENDYGYPLTGAVFSFTLPAGESTLSFEGAPFEFTNGQNSVLYASVDESTVSKAAYITNVEFGSNYGEKIGGIAFKGSSITSLVLPKQVLSVAGFESCLNLTSVFIPKSVQEIGNNAFNGCSNLTTFTIEAGSELRTTGNGSFGNTPIYNNAFTENGQIYLGSQNNPYFICLSATNGTVPNVSSQCEVLGANCYLSATFPEITIPASVRSISMQAFMQAETTSYVFEQNSQLKYIDGSCAFGLIVATGITPDKNIVFPPSLEFISKAAFSLTPFKDIDFGNGNLKEIRAGAFSTASEPFTTLRFGNKLEKAEGIIEYRNAAQTATMYFNYSASDPVLFDPTKLLTKGASKGTMTYNIYTDSPTIKDGVLTSVDEYTLVNVYHYDGSAWA